MHTSIVSIKELTSKEAELYENKGVEFEIPTASSLLLELSNGDLILVWTSEWGGGQYIPQEKQNA